jgi:hypothetical protein
VPARLLDSYNRTVHRLVAGAALAAHLAFVCFAVVGGFLAWLMPILFFPHLATAAWSARMAITDARCPLSRLENWGREGAGRPRLHDRGFIAHYFEDRIYPSRWARKIEVAVGAVVVTSWVGLAVR